MNDIISLCRDAISYPRNFAQHNLLEQILDEFWGQLNKHEQRLFLTAGQDALLDFYEFDHDATQFWPIPINEISCLKSHLGTTTLTVKPDPRCRFMFLCAAGNSQAPLRTTREMLTLAFTYLQVMPEFIDFVLLFGKQEYARDLYFSGFRQRTRLLDNGPGFKVPERNWSGHELQLCYNLKSVERSENQAHWPWSIRHCVIHHTFDIECIRSTWLIIKGNDSMKKRIQSATSHHGLPEMSSFKSIHRAFAASLKTHLIFCEWSMEGWRAYLMFLEENFETLTRELISMNADIPLEQVYYKDRFAAPPRTDSQKSRMTAIPRGASTTFKSIISKTRSFKHSDTDITTSDPHEGMFLNSFRNWQPIPPNREKDSSHGLKLPSPKTDKHGQRDFQFEDIQKVQALEERTNEVILTLKSNLNVIAQLTDHYASLMESFELSLVIIDACQADMLCFKRSINGIKKDIDLQVSRAEMLLCLLGDRKTLLYGAIEFRRVRANEMLALQTRTSSKNVEIMTRDMGEIARKTKTETVSMRIITLVTLFFLPGTFISTLMSTDIVHWDKGQQVFQWPALKVYLCVSIAFMAATFAFWGIMQLLEQQKEKKRKEALDQKTRDSEP